MLQWGLYAASLRLPFLPTYAGLGSAVMDINPDLRTVRSPYDGGEELVAVPAIHLDAAFVHLNRADARGNAVFTGPDLYFDDLFLGAAAPGRRFLSVERIVPTDELTEGRCHADAHRPLDGRRRDRGTQRRPLHQLRARLRAGRGVPAALRRRGPGSRDVEGVRRPLPRPATRPTTRRQRPARTQAAATSERPVTDSPVTRAEVCVVAWPRRSAATARSSPRAWAPSRCWPPAWPGRRSSPTCWCPTARPTSSTATCPSGAGDPTDRGVDPVPAGVPHAWAGRRHVIMGASQIDRYGNQNIAAMARGPGRRPSSSASAARRATP